jgi:hypothetical protein
MYEDIMINCLVFSILYLVDNDKSIIWTFWNVLIFIKTFWLGTSMVRVFSWFWRFWSFSWIFLSLSWITVGLHLWIPIDIYVRALWNMIFRAIIVIFLLMNVYFRSTRSTNVRSIRYANIRSIDFRPFW